MYTPSHFAESEPAKLAEAIRAARLGELVTYGDAGLTASTLPFLYEPGAGHGRLVGHLARSNPQWRSFDPAVEALVMFRCADAYVSPSLYPSKVTDARVVPTWNYVAVHAYGMLHVHDDPVWTEALVRRLTYHHEAGRSAPWSVDDAPPDFVQRMVRAVVGIELAITRIEGKWKLSQNRSEEDVAGVIRGLEAGSPGDRRVAELMRETARTREQR